jgi:hypothetical protein
VIKALVLVAATVSEHWVCALPVDPSVDPRVDPSLISLFDFETDWDELIY